MKSIYKILMLIAVILSITACGDDFLDQTPQQSVDSDLAISTLADAKIALNGCYDAFQEETVLARDYYVVCDIASDNSKLRPENSGRFLSPYYWSMTATDGYVSDFWTDTYDAINRVNNILVKIDDLEGDDAERARIKGEASGLRALGHLILVNYFAQAYNENPAGPGIPILTEPAGVDYEPSRNTIAEVYTQILADLEVADNNLNYTSSNLYFSKGAAKVLKSRVYLYMNDWANAKAEAEELINSGAYSLAPYELNPDEKTIAADYYVNAWALDNNDESIFSIGFTTVDNQSVDMLGYMYLKSGYGDAIPTTDLMDLYSDTDMRNYWFYVDGDYTYTNKYPGLKSARPGVDNIPVARLSEAYLNAAEANYELGNETEALAQVNAILKRADAGSSYGSSGAALLSDILKERRKELAFEGHRFWDLKRRGLDIVRVDRTVENAAALIEAGSNDYAFPIPQIEINVNTNIVQNPGY
jgi:hypothetical protein